MSAQQNIRMAFNILGALIEIDNVKKPRVRKVASKKPREIEPDLGMPAGTLYDVIGKNDII